MRDGWKKYGLTREDFIKYKVYFFKMLEDAGVQKINKSEVNADIQENNKSEVNAGIQEINKSEKSVNQKHDKSFKNIFMEKEEMSKFLQQFMEIQVEPEKLEEQKNSYINKQFEKRESDIIYKIKNKEIYVLAEHQSRVDKRIPRRIFEYCMGIMMAIEKGRQQDDGTNPIIIPVVIYTGKEKWTVNTNFSDTQKSYKGYENYKMNLSYKLIDINKYSKEELLEKNTKFAYMLILEKCKTREELMSELVEMLLKAQSQELVNWIEQLIKYVFADKLGEDGNKILEILEKGEMSDMEDLLERIEVNEARIRRNLINRGRRQGRSEGRAQGIVENMLSVIKNMLQQNEDEEKIMKYTNAKKEDIEKVKKQFNM